jgi:hypothetical protein
MMVGCGARRAPTHATSTPVRAALGWFKAINEKNTPKAKSYLAPQSQYMMDWGPASTWSTFTNLNCKTLSATRTQAAVYCTFHESASPSADQPSAWWSIDLRRAKQEWLIDNYGQP